jgi:hypothetical protein
MAIKTLDPEVARALIEGVEDVITPAADAEAKLYAEARCPKCFEAGANKKIRAAKIIKGEDGTPEVVQSPFAGDDVLCSGHAQCQHCGCEYGVQSGIVLNTGALLTSVQDSALPHIE